MLLGRLEKFSFKHYKLIRPMQALKMALAKNEISGFSYNDPRQISRFYLFAIFEPFSR